MSGFVLKLIAMVTMIIDHVTAVFVPTGTVAYFIGRAIGRVAFPLFCFLLVEGFYHTKSIKKYVLRLAAFALISEIPFDLAIRRKFFDWNYQSVMLTLLIGLVCIGLVEYIKQRFYPMQLFVYTVLSSLVMLAAGILAMALGTDYGMFGIVVILIMYFARRSKPLQLAGFIGASVLSYGLSGTETIGALAFIFIFLYNGKKGPDDKKAFYLVYPLHLLVLGILKMFVFV
ncbi:MAG: hypothetical protein J6113_09005 [Lachnospiraceae bacterium]|nr:hypothetical protein [Lachnospiraceae bacterium]